MKTASIQYQNAVTDDLSDLLSLENLCFGPRKHHRKVIKRYFLSQIARCITAKKDDQLVGYVLCVFSPNMKTSTIYALAVHPNMRHQGIGENLLSWAEVEAIQCSASQIGVELQYENDGMRHMLENNGYDECSDPLSMIPEYADGIKMKKRLFSDTLTSNMQTRLEEIEIAALNADHFSFRTR